MHKTPVTNSIAVSKYAVDTIFFNSKAKKILGMGHFMGNKQKFELFYQLHRSTFTIKLTVKRSMLFNLWNNQRSNIFVCQCLNTFERVRFLGIRANDIGKECG